MQAADIVAGDVHAVGDSGSCKAHVHHSLGNTNKISRSDAWPLWWGLKVMEVVEPPSTTVAPLLFRINVSAVVADAAGNGSLVFDISDVARCKRYVVPLNRFGCHRSAGAPEVLIVGTIPATAQVTRYRLRAGGGPLSAKTLEVARLLFLEDGGQSKTAKRIFPNFATWDAVVFRRLVAPDAATYAELLREMEALAVKEASELLVL